MSEIIHRFSVRTAETSFSTSSVCVSFENPYCSHVGSIKISLHCPLARDALLHIIKNISHAVIKIAAL